jgi:hypothetical protein
MEEGNALTAMGCISDAHRALEALEKPIREMGGGIVQVNDVSTSFDQTLATITINFDPARLKEYISQSLPQDPCSGEQGGEK